MTESKRKYIPLALFERMSRRNKNTLIPKYHTLCEKKYDWRVNPARGSMYYCNGDRPTLMRGDTVYCCNWTPETWDSVPYKAYIHPSTGELIEHYARHGLPSLAEYGFGYKQEDSRITSNGRTIYYGMYRDNGANLSAHYFVNDDAFLILVNGSQTEYVRGKHIQGASFSRRKEVAKPLPDFAMRAAKAMNTQKYKGVYAEFITRLVQIYGLNETQI